jgi:hypothetical protein
MDQDVNYNLFEAEEEYDVGCYIDDDAFAWVNPDDEDALFELMLEGVVD